MKCSACHSKLKLVRDENGKKRTDGIKSSWTNSWYCPPRLDRRCKSRRRKLIRSGQVDRELQNKDVIAAIKRRG